VFQKHIYFCQDSFTECSPIIWMIRSWWHYLAQHRELMIPYHLRRKQCLQWWARGGELRFTSAAKEVGKGALFTFAFTFIRQKRQYNAMCNKAIIGRTSQAESSYSRHDLQPPFFNNIFTVNWLWCGGAKDWGGAQHSCAPLLQPLLGNRNSQKWHVSSAPSLLRAYNPAKTPQR